MSLFKELKRRNVFRVGIAYTVAAWLLIQVTDIVFPRIGLPDSAVTLVIALLVIGFIPALIFAWAYEMTPDGIKRENAYSSILDARFAGPFILAETVKGCFCGAPFDLEATPNFKKRIEEAGFNWPPHSPIKFPAKDW